MINLHEFRAGQYSVPFSCGDELPECCFTCVYLLYDDTGACLCGSRFNYFCGYAWPDKLTHDRPALPPGPPIVSCPTDTWQNVGRNNSPSPGGRGLGGGG